MVSLLPCSPGSVHCSSAENIPLSVIFYKARKLNEEMFVTVNGLEKILCPLLNWILGNAIFCMYTHLFEVEFRKSRMIRICFTFSWRYAEEVGCKISLSWIYNLLLYPPLFHEYPHRHEWRNSNIRYVWYKIKMNLHAITFVA